MLRESAQCKQARTRCRSKFVCSAVATDCGLREATGGFRLSGASRAPPSPLSRIARPSGPSTPRVQGLRLRCGPVPLSWPASASRTLPGSGEVGQSGIHARARSTRGRRWRSCGPVGQRRACRRGLPGEGGICNRAGEGADERSARAQCSSGQCETSARCETRRFGCQSCCRNGERAWRFPPLSERYSGDGGAHSV